ncbi:MAG: terminase small subunit [Cyanobacteria bacterium P01_D01_bin.36]
MNDVGNCVAFVQKLTGSVPTISPTDELFCRKYVEHGNKSQAAREIGHSKSPNTIANRILKKPGVQDFVNQLKQERDALRQVTATGVIIELAKTAFFDFAEMVDCLQGNGSLNKENWSIEARSAVSSIKVTRTYSGDDESGRELNITTEIKTWDRLRALKMLGDHVGAFTDLNVAIAVLRTYGINLAKIDGQWQVINDGGA